MEVVVLMQTVLQNKVVVVVVAVVALVVVAVVAVVVVNVIDVPASTKNE